MEAQCIRPDTKTTCANLTVFSYSPEGSRPQIVVDAEALKPQGEEAQIAISELPSAAAKLGIARVVVVIGSSLTKLQLMRILKDAIKKGVVTIQAATAARAG